MIVLLILVAFAVGMFVGGVLMWISLLILTVSALEHAETPTCAD